MRSTVDQLPARMIPIRTLLFWSTEGENGRLRKLKLASQLCERDIRVACKNNSRLGDKGIAVKLPRPWSKIRRFSSV